MPYWTYLILYLTLLNFVTCGKPGKTKRTLLGPLCPRGCTACSPVNGCLTCRQNLFLLLHRVGMRQTGVCTHACPVGYYGIRREEFSKCYRCRMDNCQACFTKNYCTHCMPPYLAYAGRCIEKCPEGFLYANYSRECVENVDCLVSSWSDWTHCVKNGRTCGHKYGQSSRTRLLVQVPSVNGKRCPVTTESRRCEMDMQKCVDLSASESKPGKSRRHRYNHRKRKRRKCKKKRGRAKKKCKRRRAKDKKRTKHKRTVGTESVTSYTSVMLGTTT